MKKILASLSICAVLSSSLFGMGDGTIVAGAITTQTSSLLQDGKLNLMNDLFSTQVGFNGQKAMDSMLEQSGMMGYKYAPQIKNVLTSCFDIPEMPDFFKQLNLGGIDFCGIGEANDILNGIMGKGAKNMDDNGKVSTSTKKDAKTDKTVTNGSKSISVCSDEDMKAIVAKYGFESDYDKTLANIKKAGLECIPNGGNKNQLISNKDKNAKAIIVSDTFDGKSYSNDISELNNVQTDINAKNNMINNPDKVNIQSKIDADIKRDEGNLNIRNLRNEEIEFQYALRYNPNFVFPSSLNEEGTVKTPDTGYNAKLNKTIDGAKYSSSSEFTNKSIAYIVPGSKQITDGIGSGVDLNLYDVTKYQEASIDMKKSLENSMGENASNSKSSLNIIDKMGGITPFTSSIVAYKQFSKAIGDNVFTKKAQTAGTAGAAEEAGENGELGFKFGMLQGSKGIMFQLMLLNQQLENQSRTTYNVQTLNHERDMRIKMDVLNSNLEDIKTQNANIIMLLNKIANK